MTINVNNELCQGCKYCEVAIDCPGKEYCTNCEACVIACPNSARSVGHDPQKSVDISCYINGHQERVPNNATVLKVLESLNINISTSFPVKGSIFAPCRTGGCFSCAVLINNEIKQSCITPIKEGMKIETETSNISPLRVISGFQGHFVGGVGTPKNEFPSTRSNYLEVACFASGCLYRCPTCQNWQITYLSKAKPLSPIQAAKRLTTKRLMCDVDRLAISGGESTLNRKWLIDFILQLKKYNPDEKARFHIDTNAAILTPDYIDELVSAGMTDIGPDLKGASIETFMKITNVNDKNSAKEYLETSWNAVKYILDNYTNDVFIGVGIPYNKSFMSYDELYIIGADLVRLDSNIQVTVLDYRPEFRGYFLQRPLYQEMEKIKMILISTGLKNVICQTTSGYIR